jgi:hypothetical protein
MNALLGRNIVAELKKLKDNDLYQLTITRNEYKLMVDALRNELLEKSRIEKAEKLGIELFNLYLDTPFYG